VLAISNPVDFPMPDRSRKSVSRTSQPTILVPAEYVGPVMELCNDKRGRFAHMEYLTSDRVRLDYDLPLAEIVLDSSICSRPAVAVTPASTTN